MMVSIIHYWYGVILITIAGFFLNDNMAFSKMVWYFKNSVHMDFFAQLIKKHCMIHCWIMHLDHNNLIKIWFPLCS